jgi:hypothetical protein
MYNGLVGLYYHISHKDNRQSIRESGLYPRRPSDQSSAGEAMRNGAGAAVYLWKDWSQGTQGAWPNHDLWAVEIDDSLVADDPSNLGAHGAVHVIDGQSVPPQSLRYVGQLDRGRSVIEDGRTRTHVGALTGLTPEDLTREALRREWIHENSGAWALARAELDRSLDVCSLDAWAYYDGPDEDGDWRTVMAVCTSADRPGLVLTAAGWTTPEEAIDTLCPDSIDLHDEYRLRQGLANVSHHGPAEVTRKTMSFARVLAMRELRPTLSQSAPPVLRLVDDPAENPSLGL